MVAIFVALYGLFLLLLFVPVAMALEGERFFPAVRRSLRWWRRLGWRAWLALTTMLGAWVWAATEIARYWRRNLLENTDFDRYFLKYPPLLRGLPQGPALLAGDGGARHRRHGGLPLRGAVPPHRPGPAPAGAGALLGGGRPDGAGHPLPPCSGVSGGLAPPHGEKGLAGRGGFDLSGPCGLPGGGLRAPAYPPHPPWSSATGAASTPWRTPWRPWSWRGSWGRTTRRSTCSSPPTGCRW